MRRSFNRSFRPVCRLAGPVLAAAILLAGCAGTPKTAEDADDPYAPNDPIENVNRQIFEFNLALDRYVLKPTAQAYRWALPEFARNGVRNFLYNLSSPLILANDALQANGERAGTTFARFWINSILGFGGVQDVATGLGIQYHDEDFGQTLAVWGAPEGPYLMLPVFGPSNPRDAAGLGATFVSDPFTLGMDAAGLDYIPYIRSVTSAVDTRSRNIELFDQIERTSLDYYATVRSLYRQRRAAEIRNDDAAAAGAGAPALTPTPATPQRTP
ncbi:MAG TPA: VacJ family lipoprotein [Stellaceae bacterium]|jgi:phospholipid-binding lipoprotein MlaA